MDQLDIANMFVPICFSVEDKKEYLRTGSKGENRPRNGIRNEQQHKLYMYMYNNFHQNQPSLWWLANYNKKVLANYNKKVLSVFFLLVKG